MKVKAHVIMQENVVKKKDKTVLVVHLLIQ